MKNKLTKEDILHIAKLSKLTLTEKELEKITPQLIETLDFVDNLEEIDTSKAESFYSSSRKDNAFFNDGEDNKRLLSQDEAVSNAPKKKDGLFVVEKIM